MKHKLIIFLITSVQFSLFSALAVNIDIEHIKNIQEVTTGKNYLGGIKYSGKLPNDLGTLSCTKYITKESKSDYICTLIGKDGSFDKAVSEISTEEIYEILESKYKENATKTTEQKEGCKSKLAISNEEPVGINTRSSYQILHMLS